MLSKHQTSRHFKVDWKEYEGKYNFRSTYSPTANWRPEHVATNVEGAVEQQVIQANACFRNAILYESCTKVTGLP